MLEVHVEQGAVLEKKGYRIGVVEAISGVRQFDVAIRGKANHAGATPMPDRLDALQTAARIIVAIDDMAASSSPNTVATVGRICCEPDQINIIPGLVRFSLDVRDSNKSRLKTATAGICRNIAEMCADRRVTCEIGELTHAEPVILNDGIIQLLEKKTREKNTAPLRMISGAGHDAALVAALTPTGMIFVPSREGLSHCPEEFTRMEDVALGCDILLAAIVELAQ
jgi:allantoate deiminase